MKTFPVIHQGWTEYERGWGCRADGESLHLSKEDMLQYNKEYNLKHNNEKEVPHEYTKPDGNAEIISVSEVIYNELVSLKEKNILGRVFSSYRDLQQYLENGPPRVKKFKITYPNGTEEFHEDITNKEILLHKIKNLIKIEEI